MLRERDRSERAILRRRVRAQPTAAFGGSLNFGTYPNSGARVFSGNPLRYSLCLQFLRWCAGGSREVPVARLKTLPASFPRVPEHRGGLLRAFVGGQQGTLLGWVER